MLKPVDFVRCLFVSPRASCEILEKTGSQDSNSSYVDGHSSASGGFIWSNIPSDPVQENKIISSLSLKKASLCISAGAALFMGQVDGLTLSEKNVEFVGADLAAERRPDSPTQQPFIRRLSALSTTHRCFPLDQSHSHTLSSPTQSASSPCFSCFPLHVTLSL